MDSARLDANVFKAILDALDEGIHVVDETGRTMFYNRSAARMEELDASEVIDRHVLEVFPSLTPATSTLLKVVRSGKPIINQQQTYTSFKGRTVTTVNSTLPLLVGGRVVGAVEVSRDITLLRKMSEMIVDLRAELLGKNSAGDGSPGPRLFTFDDFVGEDPRVLALKAKAGKAARTSSSVLVSGETGTGKELLVQAIHSASRRRGGPFIAQNCAAVPETLLEGILFGTARGGFTGAKDRPGLFELADKGTLYLDEINSMPVDLQAKLLRAIQDKTIRRIGDTVERRIDVRIIASTSIDPAEALAKRELRADLYYRLNVVHLAIPPLRDRRRDIPPLVGYFIGKFNRELGLCVERASPDAMGRLVSYHWPGNVRELEHAIEGAMNLVEGNVIEVWHLPASLLGSDGRRPASDVGGEDGTRKAAAQGLPFALKQSVADHERNLLVTALESTGGNVSRAARLLGIPRQTLQYRLKRLGIATHRTGDRN
ncbi:MAG: sigma 54-interacting transcriptional regulator [Firmicutes bacterium]|nr:sigma 54-interacting transcriptional regulator [Bacillota bacterium]